MSIFIATISILIITAFIWAFNKVLPFRVCSICAGVSGTWLWIVGGLYLGWLKAENWQLIAGIATGGSIVGIAYQLEKRILDNRLLLLWKTLFIPAGFIAVYSVLTQRLIIFLIASIFLSLTAFLFLRKRNVAAQNNIFGEPRPMGREELKKKMKNCC